ncbi:MAG: hypothetical protein AAFZ58_01875 [Pseudomonadota bacterium]
MNTELLGRLLTHHLRDVSLEMCDGILAGRFESPGHREHQAKLANLSAADRQRIFELVTYCVDGGINDFLHACHRESDLLRQGDESVNPGSLYWGERGWLNRYSKFGASG